MNERVRNHYMMRLGLVGEILSLRVQDRAPAPPTSARDELRRMLADDLIRYYKHGDRKRTYRICEPAGFSYISEVDPRLKEHIDALIGKEKARYPGSKEYRLKKRREATLMNAMLDAGFIVDGAGYDGEVHTLYSPTLLDPAEIIRSAPKGSAQFISGAVLKQKTKGAQHTRREMSISAGSLFSDTGTMSVYIITTPKFRWYAASETQSALDIRKIREDALDIERSKERRLRAMIFAETEKIAAEILGLCGKEDCQMDPTSVFRLCYMAPLEDEAHAMDITKMLMAPNWKAKANKALALTSPLSADEDGTGKDGKKIYNLLCCNLGRIKELESRIRNNKCRVVVHDWQKSMLEEAYGCEIDAIVLSPTHFRGLLIAVQGT